MRLFPVVLLLLASVSQSSDLEVVNRKVTMVGNEVYLDAAPGAGLAWIKGLELNEGCLSLEVKGDNGSGRFVGLAFRGVDANTYDSVYVRPFVFQSDKPEQVASGVQYMSLPDFAWPVLRKLRPGEFEKSIGSRPDPTDWVQLKIQFGGGRMQAFVNGAATPQLDLALLTTQSAGRVAFWVGNNSTGGFRNLKRCDR